MLTWSTPDGVWISSELPVNDWSFPFTPESGGAAFTWAQAPCGAACAASEEMNTRRNNECFIKHVLPEHDMERPESSRIWHSVMKWRERHELFHPLRIFFGSTDEHNGSPAYMHSLAGRTPTR